MAEKLTTTSRQVLNVVLDHAYANKPEARRKMFGFAINQRSTMINHYTSFIFSPANQKDTGFELKALNITQSFFKDMTRSEYEATVFRHVAEFLVLTGNMDGVAYLLESVREGWEAKHTGAILLLMRTLHNERELTPITPPAKMDKFHEAISFFLQDFPEEYCRENGIPIAASKILVDQDEWLTSRFLSNLTKELKKKITKGPVVIIGGQARQLEAGLAPLCGKTIQFKSKEFKGPWNLRKQDLPENNNLEVAIVLHPRVADDPTVVLRQTYPKLKHYFVIGHEDVDGSYDMWGIRWSGDLDPKAKFRHDGFEREDLEIEGQLCQNEQGGVSLFSKKRL